MITSKSLEASHVLFEIKDRAGWITLNHASKRNALSATLLGEMLDVLEIFEKASIPVVIIRAAKGSRVWSAGHDIKELPQARRDPLGYDDWLEKALRPSSAIPVRSSRWWREPCGAARQTSSCPATS